MKCYTDWCNGTCFHYHIEDENEEWIDSCGGFIGEEHLLDGIVEYIDFEEYEITAVEGEAEYAVSLEEIKRRNEELTAEKS